MRAPDVFSAIRLTIFGLALVTYQVFGDAQDQKPIQYAGDMILARCPIGPAANSPQSRERVVTEVSVELHINRVLGIDDVQQTFTLSGALMHYWHVPCVAAMFGEVYRETNTSKIFNEDHSKYWWPPITLQNSISDPLMLSSIFSGNSDGWKLHRTENRTIFGVLHFGRVCIPFRQVFYLL